MHILLDSPIIVDRAFGGPGFGGCGPGFFPPFGLQCTQGGTTTTTSTTATVRTTKTEEPPPPPTKTTIIVSPTVVTSVVVITSGSTVTSATTFTSGTTVTSVLTPTSPPTASGPTDTNVPTSGGPSSASDATGDSSSSSSPASSGGSQPAAIPHQTITDTETSILPISPTSPTALTQVSGTSSTSSTASSSVVPAPSASQSHRGMSTGLIAAICIGSVILLTLAILIWISCRKRAARRNAAGASAPVDPEDGGDAPQSTMFERGVRISTASPIPENDRTSPAIAEHMEEKRDTISRYSDSGETASSPGSSSALSSFPLLSPGSVTPTDAQPLARMQPFRIAWDAPPPTPSLRPTSLRSGEAPTSPRSPSGDGYLISTTENCDPPRGSVYVAYLAPVAGRSEVTLGQPPEYSRY